MVSLAILESEDVAKNILFELMRALKTREWTFDFFTKVSDLAKAEVHKNFDIVVFHEKYDVPRISQSFVLGKPRRIILYTGNDLAEQKKMRLPYQRIIYLDRDDVKAEMQTAIPLIELLLKREEDYLFTYHNISFALRISDIYYIEKDGKYLLYHTKRGEFRERKNMKDAAAYFEPYDFIWIHVTYLVNMQYVNKIDFDRLFLMKEILPISRSRRLEVVNRMHKIIGK